MDLIENRYRMITEPERHHSVRSLVESGHQVELIISPSHYNDYYTHAELDGVMVTVTEVGALTRPLLSVTVKLNVSVVGVENSLL